jgi:hypothetical protein
MSYRENVQMLCDTINIPNPIPENAIWLKGISFKIRGRWKKIAATDKNRAGFLFFQEVCRIPDHDVISLNITMALKFAAKAFFAERWDGAEKNGSQMLIAFKKATKCKLHRY